MPARVFREPKRVRQTIIGNLPGFREIGNDAIIHVERNEFVEQILSDEKSRVVASHIGIERLRFRVDADAKFAAAFHFERRRDRRTCRARDANDSHEHKK